MADISWPDFVKDRLTQEEQERLTEMLAGQSLPFIALNFHSSVQEIRSIHPERQDIDSGKMNLIAQFSLGQFDLAGITPIKEGLLRIFLGEDYHSRPAKDATCFKIDWQPEPACAPDLVSHVFGRTVLSQRQILLPEVSSAGADPGLTAMLNSWIEARNESVLGGSYLFADKHLRLAEAKDLSAFAANGITYSSVRASDSCYSHLTEAAKNWRLVLRMLLPNGEDFLLMMHKDDLEKQLLQKAWLVRF
jgi:hypothetical protein